MDRCTLKPVGYEMIGYGTWGWDEEFARGVASQSKEGVGMDSLNSGGDLATAEPACILQFMWVNGELKNILAWLSQ